MVAGVGEANQANKAYYCPQSVEILSYSSPVCSQKMGSRKVLI